MENLEPYQIWLWIGAIACGAFLFGRATANGGLEERERRQRIEEQDIETALAQLSPEKLEDIDRLIKARKKLDAIRTMREATGLGLKLSKLAVERRAADQGR